ncbi:MAG: hypothetical protein WCY75_01990 [Sulfurimonadaceae bacterium]
MISTTKEYLEEGVSNIYEATFNFEGILIMVDILKVASDGVSINEVKSSTEVKDIYLHDVSIQYYVLKNLGFSIKSANVVHINNEYERGESLELDKLFKIVDVTSEVQNLQSNIPSILKDFGTIYFEKDFFEHPKGENKGSLKEWHKRLIKVIK